VKDLSKPELSQQFTSTQGTRLAKQIGNFETKSKLEDSANFDESATPKLFLPKDE